MYMYIDVFMFIHIRTSVTFGSAAAILSLAV